MISSFGLNNIAILYFSKTIENCKAANYCQIFLKLTVLTKYHKPL